MGDFAFLAAIIFGSIFLMCVVTQISVWIWPNQTLLPWEEVEQEERNRKNNV